MSRVEHVFRKQRRLEGGGIPKKVTVERRRNRELFALKAGASQEEEKNERVAERRRKERERGEKYLQDHTRSRSNTSTALRGKEGRSLT